LHFSHLLVIDPHFLPSEISDKFLQTNDSLITVYMYCDIQSPNELCHKIISILSEAKRFPKSRTKAERPGNIIDVFYPSFKLSHPLFQKDVFQNE
jgi:hypothetical protein